MGAVEVDLHAGLEVVGNRLHTVSLGLDRVERAMLRPPAQPFFARQVAAGVVGAGPADLVLDLGGPPSGRFWYVMGFTAGGLTWATAAAGTVLLVVSSGFPRVAADLGTADVYDAAAAMPVARTYSRGQIPVDANAHVFAIIVGGTAAQRYTAAATVEQYEQGARAQTATA